MQFYFHQVIALNIFLIAILGWWGSFRYLSENDELPTLRTADTRSHSILEDTHSDTSFTADEPYYVDSVFFAADDDEILVN